MGCCSKPSKADRSSGWLAWVSVAALGKGIAPSRQLSAAKGRGRCTPCKALRVGEKLDAPPRWGYSNIVPEISEFTGKDIERFARCELPIDQWHTIYWLVRGDARIRKGVKEIIAGIRDDEERERVGELHEVLILQR